MSARQVLLPGRMEEHLLALPDAVLSYSNPGDVALDPCAGSAPSLVAAKNTERNCIGIEADPESISLAHSQGIWATSISSHEEGVV